MIAIMPLPRQYMLYEVEQEHSLDLSQAGEWIGSPFTTGDVAQGDHFDLLQSITDREILRALITATLPCSTSVKPKVCTV